MLLALIGDEWLTARDAMGRPRIAQSTDFVHQEIARALQQDIPVIPVLLQGATVPAQQDLPDALKGLSLRNAMSVADATYAADLERMTRGIESVLGEDQATVVHAVRRERDWTSATAFGKEVSVEFTFTPKRRQIVYMTVGAVFLTAVVLTTIILIL